MRISTSLVQILLGNLNAEDDGHIDYDKLLSGKLKSGYFPMDVYTAYKTMEQSWETLSQVEMLKRLVASSSLTTYKKYRANF